MNELVIAQIVAVTTIVLQLLKAYIPALTSDGFKRYLPGVAVLLGLLISAATTLPTSTFGLAWAYAAAVYGVIAGLTASGAYDLGVKRLFEALSGVKPPTLPTSSAAQPPSSGPGDQSPPGPAQPCP